MGFFSPSDRLAGADVGGADAGVAGAGTASRETSTEIPATFVESKHALGFLGPITRKAPKKPNWDDNPLENNGIVLIVSTQGTCLEPVGRHN